MNGLLSSDAVWKEVSFAAYSDMVGGARGGLRARASGSQRRKSSARAARSGTVAATVALMRARQDHTPADTLASTTRHARAKRDQRGYPPGRHDVELGASFRARA